MLDMVYSTDVYFHHRSAKHRMRVLVCTYLSPETFLEIPSEMQAKKERKPHCKHLNTAVYSLVLNVATGWFIWNFFTKHVSYKTHVCCDTIFVKKFQMNQPVVTFGTREYFVGY